MNKFHTRTGGVAFLAAGLSCLAFGPRIAFDSDRGGSGVLSRKDTSGGSADLDEITRAIERRDSAMALKMEAVKTTATEVKSKLDEHEARFFEIDQRMARLRGSDNVAEESWGQQFVNGVDLKAFHDSTRRRPSREALEVKTTVTLGSTSGGPLTAPYRDDAVMLPRRRLTIRDLIPTIRISTGTVEFPKQTSRPAAADMVAEGALKPESAMGFTMQTAVAQVIAHWIPASNQILEDAPQLAGIIDTELRYGLQLKEEQQLLNGSGVSPNLQGLVTGATAFVAAFTPAMATLIDMVGLGLYQAALTDFEPDGIVLNPADWQKILLAKDAGGNYILSPVQQATQKTLWGYPVVTTQAMAAGKFLAGSFQSASTIYDRWAPRVEISTEHADYFVRNLVAIRAEERLAHGVKNANALVYGNTAPA